MFLPLLYPCPGQCDLAGVCKSEEALRGLDWIVQLHHKLCANTQANFANAAGMKNPGLSSVYLIILAGSPSSESLEINFAVVLNEFQQLNLDVVHCLIHSPPSPPVRIPSAIPLWKTSLRCRQTSMSAKWRRRSATSVSEHLKVLLL